MPANDQKPLLALAGGVLAAIAASLCCLGPLVLVLLGVGGALGAQLKVFEPFRPFFLGAAVVALVFAWRKLYRPAACTPGSPCAQPRTARLYKVLFWLTAALVVLAFVFPLLAPLFY
jgi:mercuric ion transport protein